MDLHNFQKIYESKKSILYKGEYKKYKSQVILKTINSEYPSEEQIARLLNEFYNSRDIPGARKAFEKLNLDGKPILVMEYFEAIPLKEYFAGNPVNIHSFLKVAANIAQAIGEIHQKNIIHKDINSENILINHSGDIRIIDFGISTKYNIKKQNLANPDHLEGSLAYISPEQTGRMNRTVDYRTDLYSFGVVLYEAFCGRLPFIETESLQLTHSHIARPPAPLYKINDKIPKTLSDIVLKLLSKNAENRYQSAFGLKHDLLRCLDSLTRPDCVFQLGEKDFCGRLSIPEKLYGRENEIDSLIQTYNRVSEGDSELLLIAGPTGVGKSALVHEILKPVTRKQGIYIEGKFDQFQKNIPYYAIVQAFTDAAHLLLKENDKRFAYWKKTIEDALGNSGRVISELIPEMELIFGIQPDLPKLEGKEALNRFHYVWSKFVKAICTDEHPVVLFVDDMQWADSSSLNLLKVLLTDREIKHFMCIVAYRDNETDATHPFIQMIDELQNEILKINKLKITNLRPADINQLLADALFSNNQSYTNQNIYRNPETQILAELIYHKTLGNAFFATQFLKILSEENLIVYDFEKNSWSWDFANIEQKNITDNVLELLVDKSLKLPRPTQDVLKIAACIGNRFNISLLSAVYGQDMHETKLVLEPAIFEGLLLPLDHLHYKFVHDRIQQAVYSTIPNDKKNNFHFQIGKLLYTNIPENKKEKRIFDIVNQLNYGISFLSENNFESTILAKLNYQAGLKAKLSSAYEPAYKYLKIAETLLPANSWTKNYPLSLEIYNELTEISYLNGEYKKTEEYEQIIKKNASDILDVAKASFSLLNSLRAQAKYEEAVFKGIEIARQLGINIPDVSKFQLALNLIKTNISTGKPIDKLMGLPLMSNDRIKSAIRVLDAIGTSAFNSNPQLLAIMVFYAVRLAMRYGYTESSPYSVAAYGLILCNLNKIEKAQAYGELASAIHEKHQFNSIKCKTAHMNLFFIKTWKNRVHDLLPEIYKNHQTGLETGDFEFAGFSLMFFFGLSLNCRTNLKELHTDIEKHSGQIIKLCRDSSTKAFLYFVQIIENLISDNPDQVLISGNHFDETTEINKLRENKAFAMLMRFYQAKLCMAFLFNRPREIEPLIKELDAHKNIGQGYYFHALLNFYKSLCLLDVYKQKGFSEKQYILRTVKTNQKQMKIWAKSCPENFMHKYLLVEANRKKILGKNKLAKVLFDQSIQGASNYEFIQEEAMAWESAARFYFEQNQMVLGKYYIQNAYRCYYTWGATAKLKQLENLYPTYISKTILSNLAPGHNGMDQNITSATTSTFDLNSIIQASQSISGEVNFENLLQRMLTIVMENTGAGYAVFIKNDDDYFTIQAKGKHGGKNMETMQSETIENSNSIPIGIIKFVIRTNKSLVLNNAIAESKFAEPYIQNNNVLSALCHPVMYKNKLVAILYLENNLSPNVFTTERIEIVNILSSQIAVSMENAMLYETLEKKVIQRTLQLQKALEELEKSHKSITDSINYASRIQMTILPEKQIINQYFPQNFILDKPKDIVSGDFYWFANYNQTNYLAAVDCTGHGVPGAFMSIIGHNILNKALFEKKLIEPNQILNFLSNEIRISLRQKLGDTSIKDGMDLILCAFNFEHKTLKFSGVHIPLVLIRDGKATSYKTDNFEIGAPFNSEFQSYNQQETDIMPNDLVYIFSDGFIDQPGEKTGAKFLSKNFRKVLMDIHSHPMETQKKELNKIITEWKGNKSQIDDILVIGIKIPTF